MGKDSSKLHKPKPPKSEGNKILGVFERKPVASSKHGHQKSEVTIEVKEIGPPNTDHPNDTKKIPEAPLGVSEPLLQSPPKDIVPPGSPMKDVTLPTKQLPPEATLDKTIEHKEDQVLIEKVIPEPKGELTNQEVLRQADEQTQQLLHNQQDEAASQKHFQEQRDEILMHLNTIHNQKEEILSHRKTIQDHQEEISHHQQEIRDKQSEIEKHCSIIADRDKEILMHVEVVQEQEKNISNLNKTNKDQAKKIGELLQQIQTLQQELDQSKTELAEYAENFPILVKHVEKAEDDRARLTRRIEHLERCITETRSPQAPNKVESYYVKQLERLNQYISSKVADLCKREHAKIFRAPEQAINDVLRTLQELGSHGEVSATMLGQGLVWTLDTDVRRRIAVLRHIIALFLQSRVFDLFAFGLDPQTSKTLRNTEDTIAKIELDFSKVLTVRQAIGKATLHQLGTSTRPEILKSTLIENLERTISQLLPSPRDVHQMVLRIAKEAVDLADEMTGEQTMFRCTFVDLGTESSLTLMHVADHRQKGQVALCTFPGFWRVAKESDGGQLWFPLVKPCVELQSAFE